MIDKIAKITDNIVSIIVLLVAIRLVFYMLTKFAISAQAIFDGEFWLYNDDAKILDWIVYYIVMVKAYKVLISYAKHHHVSIRYVTELIIIACFVEFIFESHLNDVIRAVFGAIGVISLFIYLYFYDTIKHLGDS